MNTIQLTIASKGSTQVQSIPVNNSKAYVVNGSDHTAYILKNPDTGSVVNKIFTKKSSNDLLVSLSEESPTLLIIEDFYSLENADLALITESTNGIYYNYQPMYEFESARIVNLASGGSAVQVVAEEEAIAPWWLTSGDIGSSYLLPGLLLAGGVAALASKGGDDADTPSVKDPTPTANENQTTSLTGEISVSDASSMQATTMQGTYGEITLTPSTNGSVTWEYTVDNQAANVLKQDEVFTEDFTVGTGTSAKQIKINVTGLNDAPVAIDEATQALDLVWGDANINNQLVNNLGGAKGFGEHEVDRLADDSSSDPIDITSVFGPAGLNFYGKNYESMFINANGNITFDRSLDQYTPEAIENLNFPIIAPFWADVDQSNASNPDINHIWYDLDGNTKTLTITWDHVGYYEKKIDKLNTFQMQIKDTGSGDFDVFFRYEDIQWTFGDVSYVNGVDGPMAHAHAGWSSGQADEFYEIPSSGNEDYMLNLPKFSNSGNAGVFEFNVRDGVVYDGNSSDYIVEFDVLANDVDFDHDADITLVDANIIDGKGTVSIEDGKVIYKATSEALTMAASEVVIEYTIQDEFGLTSKATARVDLSSNFVNTAPLSVDFSAETSGTYLFTEADFPFIDPDLTNSFKAVTITELPLSGTLTFNGTAIVVNTQIMVDDLPNLIYTVASNSTDDGVFKYTVQDNGGTANSGNDTSEVHTATIKFKDISHAPLAIDSTVSLIEDTSYTLKNEDFGFIDKQDNDAFKSILINKPTSGELTLGGNVITTETSVDVADIDSLVFTPGENISGPSTLQFKVLDDGDTTSANKSTDATLTFDVTSINDGAPILTGTDTNIEYTSNGTAQNLFSDISASDFDFVDSQGGYDGLTVNLTRDTPNAVDVFGSGNNAIVFTNSGHIELRGNDIGDVTNSDGQLTLEFDSGVTGAVINQTINSVSYSNATADAGDSYSFSWSITDSDPAGVLFTSYEQTMSII